MSNQEIEDLFNKYYTDSATDQELTAFKEKVGEMQDEEIEALLLNGWGRTDMGSDALLVPDNQLMLQNILSKGSGEEAIVVAGRFKWVRYAIAASLVLFIAGAGWLLFNKRAKSVNLADNNKHEVAPGGDRATLTLADGSVILLDSAGNGALASQGGTQIIKLTGGRLAYQGSDKEENKEDIVYNTITTPRRGQYQIALPDGTKVWLNAESSIRFPTVFKGRNRDVEIKGEAYLEVAVNKSQPFFVKVKDMEVEVLGTSFNVMAYEDEPSARTTLVEGRVKVTEGGSSVLLMPGQQTITSGDQLTKVTLEPYELEKTIAWKNNEFRFNNDNLEYCMRQISRWYDVKIVYEGADKTLQFGGVISRKENLSVLLKKLELTGVGVQFRMEGNTIFVK